MTTRKQRRELVRGVPLPCKVEWSPANDGMFDYLIEIKTPTDRRRFTEEADCSGEYRIATPTNGSQENA